MQIRGVGNQSPCYRDQSSQARVRSLHWEVREVWSQESVCLQSNSPALSLTNKYQNLINLVHEFHETCHSVTLYFNTNVHKQQQQTPGLIQRLSDNIQLLSIGVIVSDKLCFSKCNVCRSQVCLTWTTIPLPNRQGE